MSDILCEVKLSDIDLTDERYKISFSDHDIIFLAQSIKEAGLTYPPIVRPAGKKFIIISGFNRVKAQIYNKKTKIVAYQTKPDAGDYQCLLKSITALAFQRPLTHCELIICTRRLSSFLDKEQIAEKSPAIFNTKLNIRFVEDLLTIGTLPDKALELIHMGNLSLKSAQRISSFEKATMEIFLNIFSKIKASSSKQFEIIQHIMEITARETINPTDFFKTKAIRAIILDANKEPGLKTTQLRAYLFERRFPAIFQTHQLVREKTAALKLGGNIKLLPPENFEGQYYSISFKVKNYDEFKTHSHHLAAALEKNELKEIFNL
ncbi:ParB N-terminal domain-containing protein [Desulfobacula phenolica]|uniref:Chromosome partitioning protein, ParB family n=1 Tax=Desulfobacula phenolica TaxID=90732 RepID=A0A1H2K3H0_9BACT|nr:ParB N-terminal domain-containing protein [Desulfobacula phenolica]SDU62948.1 chromosome partitioning protein, ParB family [Desulfobacula phenolica]